MSFYNTQNERNFRVTDPLLRLTNEIEQLRLQLNSCNVDIGLNVNQTGTRGPFFLPATGSIAIGCEAANSTLFEDNQGYQEEDAIAIGHQAGQFSQETLAVAIGHLAGQFNQLTRSIAIGGEAGNTGQQDRCVAIGRYAGRQDQGTGTSVGYSTAVGAFAGELYQRGYATAFGVDAGYDNQQTYAVAVGSSAGSYNQSTGAVAVGRNAAFTGQGEFSVAVGLNSGFQNQGNYSVAVGPYAGQTNQSANSIVLNADSTPLNAANTGLFAKPVRGLNLPAAGWFQLYYNPTTGEIAYDSTLIFLKKALSLAEASCPRDLI